MKKMWGIALVIFCTFAARGQDNGDPWGHILLDSFTVTAVRQGLDLEDLIRIMQYDSTLYMAFNNLHFAAYTYESGATAYDRRREVEARRRDRVSQRYDGNCREQARETLFEEGDFENRRGRQQYYTLELFDRTFYREGRVCGERPKTNWHRELAGNTDKTGGHLAEIKQVIFNPGTPADLPIIGRKFALFHESMKPYYDYAIRGISVDGYDCYEFTVSVKPEFRASRKDVVVRDLTTVFRTTDFQIIRRDYHLSYDGALVGLDLTMDIRLQEQGDAFYPLSFDYKGYWKVPLKGMERIDLRTDFDLH